MDDKEKQLIKHAIAILLGCALLYLIVRFIYVALGLFALIAAIMLIYKDELTEFSRKILGGNHGEEKQK